MNNSFPYPGLRPFELNESHIFFGREEHTDQLLKKLGQTRFLAVIGPSGCGKSSLVRAGLLASLRAGFLSETGVHWRIADMRPGDSPYANLTKVLLDESKSILCNAYAAYFTDKTKAEASLKTSLKRGPFSLHEVLQNTPLPLNTHLLLLVDQFEEIFRYYGDRDRDNVDKAAAFVSLLLAAAQHTRAPTQTEGGINIYVVITMRDEYLRDCAIFQGLPEAINQGIFLSPRLTRDQLREAIELPAQVFGDKVEPVLLNHLLNKIGNAQEQLPVLQHALMRMWRLARFEHPDKSILTLAHYDKIGGLENALSQHAEKAYAELDSKQQEIAEILFRNLTAPNNTRRPIKLKKIATLASVSCEQVIDVVEVFRQEGRSFLTPPLDKDLTPETVLDISHESLIRLWQRLTKWVDDEAESAKIYQRLEDDACRWEKIQSDLYHKLSLGEALAWREKAKPTAQWAKRYGENFDLAMLFLDESQKEQQREEQEKEAERQQKQQQEALKRELQLANTRKLAIGAVIGLFVTIGLALWALKERNNAVQAQLGSQLSNAARLVQFEDYKSAKEVLKKVNEKTIPVLHRPAYNFLDWSSQLIGGEPLAKYDVGASLFDIAVSSNSHFLAAAGVSGKLVLFKVDNGKLLLPPRILLGHNDNKENKENKKYYLLKGNVFSVAFHPQDKWLASAGEDKQIIFWSLSTGEPILRWTAPDIVRALAVSPNGKYLASGGDDNQITLWEVKNGKVLCTGTGHKDIINNLAFRPTGKLLLASASEDKTARLWNVQTCEEVKVLKGHIGPVEKLTFSPDDRLLATSSSDKTVRLWEVDSGDTLRILQGHRNKVFGVSFFNNGKHLVSGSRDSTLRIWDTKSGMLLRVLQGHFATVNGVTSYADKIFSASNDNTIRVWDTALPYQQLVDLSGVDEVPISAAIAPDGKSVAVGFKKGALHLYSLPNPSLLWEKKEAHKARVQDIAFNSDGTLLATAGFDHLAKLWQVKDGTFKQTFEGHQGYISAVAFSPDDNLLATASDDGKIGLFTVGKEQKRFKYPATTDNEWVLSVAFDNSGTRLLSSGADNQTRLWHLEGEELTLLKAFKAENTILWASFSPDSQHIATVGRDPLVCIYSTRDYQEEHCFKGHQSIIYRAIFSPDNQQVVTASADATVRFWDLNNHNGLFTLILPVIPSSHTRTPLRDFDFRCTPQGCWIAVPLTSGKLALYELGQIYNK